MVKRHRFVGIGQSLAEYGLAAAFIAIVCIAGCSAIVGVLSDQLPGLIDRIFNGGGAVAIAPGGSGYVAYAATPDPAEMKTIIGAPEAGHVQVCTPSGLCLNIPVVEGGKVYEVETAGGMGGNLTASMADTFSQMADQLEALPAGSVDTGLIDLLRKMSQVGGDLSDDQLALANAIHPNFGDPPNCFGCSIGVSPSDVGLYDPLTNTSTSMMGNRGAFEALSAQLSSYFAAHPDALPAEVQSALLFQADQINAVADGVDVLVGPTDRDAALAFTNEVWLERFGEPFGYPESFPTDPAYYAAYTQLYNGNGSNVAPQDATAFCAQFGCG